MRKFRFAFAAAGALVLAAAGLALATGGDSGTKSSRLHVTKLAPTVFTAASPTSARGNSQALSVQTTRIARPGLTRPLRDMARVSDGKHVKRGMQELSRIPEGLGASGGDLTGALQTKAGSGDMPSPIQNFDGVARICGCLPPDTNGDVGPNHYMQWVNLHFAIYTKTGTQVGVTQPGNALWAGNPNAPNCATLNSGDPVVLYDQYAGRWFASQFAFANFQAQRIHGREPAVVFGEIHQLDHIRPDVDFRVPGFELESGTLGLEAFLWGRTRRLHRGGAEGAE